MNEPKVIRERKKERKKERKGGDINEDTKTHTT